MWTNEEIKDRAAGEIERIYNSDDAPEIKRDRAAQVIDGVLVYARMRDEKEAKTESCA